MPGIRLDHFILEPAMIILVGAKISELISPEIFPLFAIFGLSFPYALLVFFIGVVLRLIRGGWKGLVVPFIMLLFLQSSIALTIGGIGTVPELTDDSSNISVGTFNVRRMDEYQWLEGDKTRNDIFTWLSSTSLDIMCFQEMPVEMKEEVSRSLGGATVKHVGNGAGTAIATKLKIVDFEPWTFEDENFARGIILDVISPKSNDTIRVYNVHLQSVGFVGGDYDAVRSGPDTEQSKKLWSRLSSAFSRRSAQTTVLRASIDSSPYPVILCGDFNDTPVSFALSTLRSGSPKLFDAFALAGSGLGSTYVGDIPGLRIDYIMSSSSLEVVSFETHEIELSDHRPISAVFISNR
ncbi:MAG: endonuclease/exonuclease/phosphatase family protein [Flavobacteriales bacterium]|jgi:endonuclease/exonuclease/phosphatase family metal-dependent hydrolase|nr:endonuclease/exonuclease/phosphatase family protein [Flavobacteriales bacterium]